MNVLEDSKESLLNGVFSQLQATEQSMCDPENLALVEYYDLSEGANIPPFCPTHALNFLCFRSRARIPLSTCHRQGPLFQIPPTPHARDPSLNSYILR